MEDLARELQRLQRILSGSPLVPELVALIARAEWQLQLQQVMGSLFRASRATPISRLDDGISTTAARMSFATLMGPPGCHELGTTSGGLPVGVRAEGP